MQHILPRVQHIFSCMFFFFVEIVRSFGSVPSKSRRRTSLLFRTNADLEVSRFRALFVTQCFFFTRNRAFLRSFAFEFIGEEVYFSERMRPYLFANFGFCCWFEKCDLPTFLGHSAFQLLWRFLQKTVPRAEISQPRTLPWRGRMNGTRKNVSWTVKSTKKTGETVKFWRNERSWSGSTSFFLTNFEISEKSKFFKMREKKTGGADPVTKKRQKTIRVKENRGKEPRRQNREN